VPGMLRVPRTRGAFSGVLLVLLGLWGALIPLIGPYFHFAYTPDHSWHFTNGRVLLEIIPGAVVVLGGLIVVSSANRAFAALGAWLAALGGAWFAVGVPVSASWKSHGAQIGQPIGGTVHRVVESVTFFYGLGVVIVFFAALALGRFAVVGVREVQMAEEEAATGGVVSETDVPETTEPRFRETRPLDTTSPDIPVRTSGSGFEPRSGPGPAAFGPAGSTPGSPATPVSQPASSAGKHAFGPTEPVVPGHTDPVSPPVRPVESAPPLPTDRKVAGEPDDVTADRPGANA
jgi:hypothetical protein